jgi:RNA polymerase sigma factor (sigma-70 family)
MRLPSATLLRTQSDDRLVALARDGWEPAFTALVERYRREVLRGCTRVLPEGRAEDATQQVFVSAWGALRRGDEVRELRPWLLRIARNTALNALRVPGYDHADLAESLRATEAPQAELERREVVRATLTGLAALPERQREALLRSAVEGASHAEIAAGLGINEGAARQLVLRARTKMRGVATALTPTPAVTWALTRAGEMNVADTVAGGSAAGAAGLLAKAGVVAVVAGGAFATPVVQRHHRAGPAAAEAAAADPGKAGRAARKATTAEATPTSTATATATAVPPRATAAPPRRATAEAEHRRGGSSGSSRSSGRDHPQDEATEPTKVEHHHSGGGSDDDHRDGSGSSGSSGGSESESGDDHVEVIATPVATVTPAPTSGSDDGSGSSGSSGSGSLDSRSDDGSPSGGDHLAGSDD